MKNIVIMIFILLDSASLIIAQNSGKIYGKISDQTSGEEIPFANVILTRNSQQVAGITSDMMGNYTFKGLAAGKYELKVSYIGYQQKSIPNLLIKTDTSVVVLNIKLKIAAELMEMEIVEYKEPLLMMDAASESSYMPDRRSGNKTYPNPRIKREEIQKHKSHYYTPQNEFNYSNESYDKINHNEFMKANTAPLSTFSIDVDKASYSNVRRYLNMGMLPPVDAVRTEELINYFSYDYPEPRNEKPFFVSTDIAVCPWNKKHKLVQIGIQGKRIDLEELPPSNLVFLIDVSGSMNAENKLPLVKSSLRLLVNQMRKQDRISLVVYAGAAGCVLPATSGNNKETILNAIDRLSAGGSTNGAGGINLAYSIAMENFKENGNNRVVLATDGDFNVGVSNDADLVSLIERKRNAGIFLTVLGYGMGNLKDSKMEKLADKGNGNYSYIDNMQEAQKVLVKEMGGTLFTIAKDVKIQVEFNPSAVKSYRLIGYENRLLADKDFNDDTKDAGELGAGHTVTALYEIVPANSNEEDEFPDVDPLKYQTKPAIKEVQQPTNYSDELLTVKLRYKDPKESKSKLITHIVKNSEKSIDAASENLMFSAAVAQFGMLLTNSKYKGKTTIGSTIQLAKAARGKDEEGYRAEFIRLLELSNQLGMATNR